MTHAWAAGQLSQWGSPFQGRGPGSAAGLGGHGFPERWGEKVLEGLPGSCPWRAELPAPTHPESALTQAPRTRVIHPMKGRGAAGKRGSVVTPGPHGTCVWPDPRVCVAAGASRCSVCLETCIFLPAPWQSPGRRKEGPFLEKRLRSEGSEDPGPSRPCNLGKKGRQKRLPAPTTQALGSNCVVALC